MKKTAVCTKCGSKDLLAVSCVTAGKYTPRETVDFVRRGVQFQGLQLGLPQDQLEMLVCRDCGFSELYVKDPKSIPVDGAVVRSID